MVKHRPGKPTGQRPAAAAIAAQFERAVAHHQRGEVVQAAALYREILAQIPWHFDALHLLAVARMQAGEHGEAVDLIRKALDLDPRNPNKPAALSNLGIALSEIGRAAEALECFERSLALAPRNAETLYNLGNVSSVSARLLYASAKFGARAIARSKLASASFARLSAASALPRLLSALT